MKIALLGDIALFGNYNLNNNRFLIEKIAEISKYLNQFDIVVGNFESPFSIKQKPSGAKSAYVCADIENIDVLKALNISIVNLANNHMFDYGKEGYETTKRILNEAKIEWFGTEGKTVEVIKDDNRLLFAGYCCYSTNPLCLANKLGDYGVNKYNINDVMRTLTLADNNKFLPIIAIHAGLEHINYPSIEHVRAARKFSDICPYIYYGHHPHAIQGVEIYQGSLIAHSLGNFCFDDVYANPSDNSPLIELSEQNRTGLILELTIKNNSIVDWKEQAIYIGNEGDIKLLEDDKVLLNEYNTKLVNCEKSPDLYSSFRKDIIEKRISQRKSKRDLSWFIKRLRFRYIKLALDMMRNAKLYNENVKKYL